MKKMIIILMTIATTLLFLGCDDAISIVSNEETSQIVETQMIEDDYIKTLEFSITDEEREGLIFMREEEKLAQDVYLYFFEKYRANIFNNISIAESSHMASLKTLLDKLNIRSKFLLTPIFT